MNAQALDEGLVLTPDELIAETSACSHCMLTFNGVVPVTGVFGIPPRDLFDMENTTPDLGAIPDPADMAARACSVRMHAKAAMLQTLSEVRVARANNTRVHTNKVFKIGDLVDLFRRPLLKDAPGWRGPGVLLDLCHATGTAIVKWQGKPWLLNLRFIRPHMVSLLSSPPWDQRRRKEQQPKHRSMCTVSSPTEDMQLERHLWPRMAEPSPKTKPL